MGVRVEIRDDVLVRVQDVFDGQPHVSRVFPGWYVLFAEGEGQPLRFGYVRVVEEGTQTLLVADTVSATHQHAPVERISWASVLGAENGFVRRIYLISEGERRIGPREVYTMGWGEESHGIGFIRRKKSPSGSVYVDRVDERNWRVREGEPRGQNQGSRTATGETETISSEGV